MLDDYYAFKGWNKEGIPTQETLDKLGLDFVSEDFLKRGILTENESISEMCMFRSVPATIRKPNVTGETFML